MTDTTLAPADGGAFSELVDAKFDRVDLVGKGANSIGILVAKADGETPDEPAALEAAAVLKAGEEETLDDAPENVDLTEPLAPGTTDGVVGDDLVPGSPAWESVDAATARKWTAVLSRAKNALKVLSEREGVESAASNYADPQDSENQWSLQDAGGAIDYAISQLATYAVSEENTAVVGTEAIEAVGKAAAAIDLEQLAVLEELGPVMKAGRVLSAGNEGKIRDAVASLSSVLDTLPAPLADDVQKETAVPTIPGPPSIDELVDQVNAERLAKVAKEATPDAAADTVVETPAAAVVKDADPLASTSEDDLRRMAIAGSGSDQKAALQELGTRFLMGTLGAAPAAAAGTDADPAEPDAAPDTDLTPAADSDVGTAADGTAPATPSAPEDSDDEPVKKSAAEILQEMIDARVEEVLKSKGLEAAIADLAAPAPSRVLLSGQERVRTELPPAHLMRGQSRGSTDPTVSVEKAEFAAELDAGKQGVMAAQMNTAAAALLAELHATPRRG